MALTILCHPDPRRIGDRASADCLRKRKPLELGRNAPEFGGRPLDDRYVSRRPVRIVPHGAGLEIQRDLDGMKLAIEGQPVDRSHVVHTVEVADRGLLIELAGRVLLLLHMAPPCPSNNDLGLVGCSLAIEEVRATIRKVAPLDIPLLIRGPSGSGKELVCEAIHRLSRRRTAPFHALNMAAIPSTTAASELFGHARGAFTGADTARVGWFEKARGGTLLLDEIGETPLDTQALLLRALETGEIQPVGARDTRKSDVRIIAATDADLEQAIARGTFRPALLHRLSSFELFVPPLRERREDIGLLLMHFLLEELKRFGAAPDLAAIAHRADKSTWLDATLVSRLCRFDWPGNVRQLRNVARGLAVASVESDTIVPGRALERLLDGDPIPDVAAPAPVAGKRRPGDIPASELIDALRAHKWRVMPTAKALGIARNSLYKLIEDHPDIRKAGDIAESELRVAFDEHQGDAKAIAAALEVSPRGIKLRLTELAW